MKFYKFVLVLLVVSILFVGCSRFSNTETLAQHNFRQGTPELEIDLLNSQFSFSNVKEFERKALPADIYEDSQFQIVLELHNEMAYDIRAGDATIVGLDPKYFDLIDLRKSFSQLEAKSVTNPPGETIFLEFAGRSRFLPTNVEERTIPFSVDVLYASTLEFAETLCIQKARYGFYDGGCEFRNEVNFGSGTFGGQGAVLYVDKADVVINPGNDYELQLRIHMRNGGTGKLEQIRFNEARLGNEELECSFERTGLDQSSVMPKGKPEEATLYCRKAALLQDSSFETILALDLEYDYLATENYRLKLIR